MSEDLLLADDALGYGATVVLSGVSFALRPGERVVLLGRSGSGKSTLLNALYQRLVMRRARVALVPQDHALVPCLSAFHNVYMGRLDRHRAGYNLLNLVWPQARERAAVAGVLGAVGLEREERRTVEAMSGGQRQRIAVARAMFRGGDILIADEPVSSVDETQAHRLLQEIERRFETTIVALHDVDIALRHATRAIGLKNGRVAFDRLRNDVSQSDIDDLYRI